MDPDYKFYFDDPQQVRLVGGSRNSGFIRRMLAERPEDFELELIGTPSMWLQQHYPLYGKEIKAEEPEEREEPKTHEGILYTVLLKKDGTVKAFSSIDTPETAAARKSIKEMRSTLSDLNSKLQNKSDSLKYTKEQRDKDPEYILFKKLQDEYNEKVIAFNKKVKARSKEVTKIWEKERDIVKAKYQKKGKKKPIVKEQPMPLAKEAPAEAIAAIEEEVADAPEEEVGKFGYNKEFFGAIDKMYNTAQRTTVRGKGVPAELFNAIVSIQNNYDLYPTPHTSLKPIFDDIDKLEGKYTTSLNFLEPSAGTGNIVRGIIDFGERRKIKGIDAVEMSADLSKLLKEQTTISNVYREDFLEFKPKHDYHYTIMNPPYTDGSNKTFWLEHLMKAMSISYTQIEEGGGLQNTIYAIVPTTYLDNMWKEYYPNGQGQKDKYIGSEWEIPFDMEVCRKKKALIAKYGWLDEDGDFKPQFFIKKIGEINDFAKINQSGVARPMGLTVGIYRLFIGSMMGGSTRRENFLKANRLEDKGYSLKELSKISDVPLRTLQQVYNRGVGAHKTNPQSVRMKGSFKKGVNAPMSKKLSKEQWAMARTYSFLDGNPKHDNDLR